MENKDTCPCKEEAVTIVEPKSTTDKVTENEVPITVPISNGPTKPRHREEKSRKKDDKSVDHVLKALNSLESTEEKLTVMCKKYADIYDEYRKNQLLLKQTEKKCSSLQREKEQLQAEQSKAILTRSRLENLCRELQRQNKAIKDENLLKIREEEEKRKEVSAKFQNTLSEITALMQQNNDKNMKLRDDNIDMTTKLKNVCEQYELREQVEKIAKQMQLESQLADAKLAKVKMEMAAEKEILLREKQQLLMKLTQYQARCQESQTTEISLRNQISLYNDKYEEFQKALERSNSVFGGFKGEMEKMSKKICKLEKETSSWKQRWERSHGALLDMAADKQKSEQDLSVAARQLTALQNLCRTLQNERAQLLSRLKAVESVPSQEVVTDEFQKPLQEMDLCTKVENLLIEVSQDQKANVPEAEPSTSQDQISITNQSQEANVCPIGINKTEEIEIHENESNPSVNVADKVEMDPKESQRHEAKTVDNMDQNVLKNQDLETSSCSQLAENKEPDVLQSQENNLFVKVVETVELNGCILQNQELQTAGSDQSTTSGVSNKISDQAENTNSTSTLLTDHTVIPPNSLAQNLNESSTSVVENSDVSSKTCHNSPTESLTLSDVCQNGTEGTSHDSVSESLKNKSGQTSNSAKGKDSSKKKRK